MGVGDLRHKFSSVSEPSVCAIIFSVGGIPYKVHVCVLFSMLSEYAQSDVSRRSALVDVLHCEK